MRVYRCRAQIAQLGRSATVETVGSVPHGGDRSRAERAREWQLTAFTALVVAVAIFGWAATASPPWGIGDVATGLYFGLLSVGLWIHGVRVRFAATAPAFSRTVRVLLNASLAVGVLLAAADVASRGRI